MSDFRKPVIGLCAAILVQAMPVQAGTPVPYNEESVALGAQLFRQRCTECHGEDGRAQVDVISDATDLTWPEDYYSGAAPGDIAAAGLPGRTSGPAGREISAGPPAGPGFDRRR